MTTRLLLVCHVATAATRAAAFPNDEPLDDQGQRRLAGLSRRLPRADHALVSPARGAIETAVGLGLQAEIDLGLRDCDYGAWRGRRLDEIGTADPEALAQWLGDPASAPHGGESLLDLIGRVAAWLDGRRIVEGRTLAVTHAAVIRAAMVHALGAPPHSFWRIDIAPLSATALSGDGRRWTLHALGRSLP
ncbi:MAG TPA: histidine phosphatase family protein [Lichenihabitans sp.]|nr:histidine phosphatase family protein [Lichenihabitans sp.]